MGQIILLRMLRVLLFLFFFSLSVMISSIEGEKTYLIDTGEKGAPCIVDGKTYQHGDMMPSLDCNDCECDNDKKAGVQSLTVLIHQTIPKNLYLKRKKDFSKDALDQ